MNLPSVRSDNACGPLLDASAALRHHGWTVHASSDDFKKQDNPYAIWRVLKALYGSPQAGNHASFPLAFINSRTSLPWYENLKRKLDEHKFLYNVMGGVKVFT
eukprot:g49206.t1